MARERTAVLILGLLLAAIVMPPSVTAMGSDGSQESQAVASIELEQFHRWTSGPASYLLSEKEQRIADALSDPAHFAAFRHWFWERRDPVPETATNEFRDAFEQRVAFVNKRFGNEHARTPGWRTAQGIVYILLGPPTRTTRTPGRVYGHFDDTPVDVWIYEPDDGPVLEVPFVTIDDAAVLLQTPDNVGMRARLDAALSRSVEACIRNRELPFSGVSPIVDAPDATGWMATGAVARTGGGIEGQITIPLTDVYGNPDGTNLRVSLRLGVAATPGGPESPLGELSFLVPPQVFERWGDRNLTIALWLPDAEAFTDVHEIRLTEVVSGRATRMALGAGHIREPGTSPAPVAQIYAVDAMIGRSTLAAGRGEAFAFIGRANPDTSSGDTMLMLRRPPELGGIVLEGAPTPCC